MSRRLVVVFVGCAVLVITGALLYANHEQGVAISSLEEKARRLDDHCAFEVINLRSLTSELASDEARVQAQAAYDFTSNFRRRFFEFTPCSTYRPNLDEARACVDRHDLACMRRINASLSTGVYAR